MNLGAVHGRFIWFSGQFEGIDGGKVEAAQHQACAGVVDDVKLPPASVDLALLVDVSHELEFPFEMIESVVRALKPGGRIVYVEYRAEDAKVPIKALHKMSQAQVRVEAAAHALAHERTANTLPWPHVVTFKSLSPLSAARAPPPTSLRAGWPCRSRNPRRCRSGRSCNA